MKAKKEVKVILTLNEGEIHMMHRIAKFLEEHCDLRTQFGENTRKFILTLKDI